MANFTIKVVLDVGEPHNYHAEKTRTVEIPPAYGLEDRRRFYAVSLERLADDLFEERGWFTPLRHALFANDARLSEIERRANFEGMVPSPVILDILNTPSEEAIEQWGSTPIED